MNNTSKLSATTQAALSKAANRLEASLSVLHSSAYPSAQSAVRVMRWLANGTAAVETMDAELLHTLISELRKYANTVANPASANLTAAAAELEALVP